MGLVALLAVVAFAVPVVVWYRYSEQIAASGGLFSFVEAAAGRRVALIQAAIWTISYFLYLPYTITYVVYDLLPAIFPGIGSFRPVLAVALPVIIVLMFCLEIRTALMIVAGLVIAQLGVLAALAIVGGAHVGVSPAAFGVHGGASELARSSVDLSLLYVCTSLPLFLGGETIGANATVKTGLVASYALSGAFVLFGTLPWARANASILRSAIPGVALAQHAQDHTFATVVGLGVAASVIGVVMAEYVALGRLFHAVSGRPIRQTMRMVGVGFLVASVLSLINPQAFYADLLQPSLIALWVSQLLVFAVFPRFVRKNARLNPTTLGLTVGALALVAYGLESAITSVTS